MNEFGRGSCWRRRNGRDQHQADGKVEMGHISCRQCAVQKLPTDVGSSKETDVLNEWLVQRSDNVM